MSSVNYLTYRPILLQCAKWATLGRSEARERIGEKDPLRSTPARGPMTSGCLSWKRGSCAGVWQERRRLPAELQLEQAATMVVVAPSSMGL
jgi:hypothetical protein